MGLAVKDAEVERQHGDDDDAEDRPRQRLAGASSFVGLVAGDFQVLERRRSSAALAAAGATLSNIRRTRSPPAALDDDAPPSEHEHEEQRAPQVSARERAARSSARGGGGAAPAFDEVGVERHERRARSLSDDRRLAPAGETWLTLRRAPAGAAEGVQLGGGDQVDARRRRPGSLLAQAEGDRLAGGAAVIEGELQVPLARPGASRARSRRVSANSGSRLAAPNGRQPGQLLGERRGRGRASVDLGVDLERAAAAGRPSWRAASATKARAERRRARRSTCSSRRRRRGRRTWSRCAAQRGERLVEVDARRRCAPSRAPPRP